jgi:hypothetical protein
VAPPLYAGSVSPTPFVHLSSPHLPCLATCSQQAWVCPPCFTRSPQQLCAPQLPYLALLHAPNRCKRARVRCPPYRTFITQAAGLPIQGRGLVMLHLHHLHLHLPTEPCTCLMPQPPRSPSMPAAPRALLLLLLLLLMVALKAQRTQGSTTTTTAQLLCPPLPPQMCCTLQQLPLPQ